MSRWSCLIVVLALISGCDPQKGSPQPVGPEGLKVVVTTSMVADLVRHIAGDRAEITTLIGEGVDPHLYRPTSDDVGKMMNSHILFYSGLGLEGAMQSVFERVAKRGKTVVAVTDQIPESELRMPPEFAGHPDPHLWNAPALWLKCLDRIAAVLSEHDPDHAAAYAERADTYRQELQKLDHYVRASIETIPAENRYLVTAHDAFGYFAKAYGLQERSVQGISTESEPGVQDVNRLIDFLVEKKIPSLFVEATVNSDSLRAVMERCAQRGWTVRQGGTLFSDSMGPPGSYEGTYPGMIDHNVTTIVRALNGTPMEGGFLQYLKRAEAAAAP